MKTWDTGKVADHRNAPNWQNYISLEYGCYTSNLQIQCNLNQNTNVFLYATIKDNLEINIKTQMAKNSQSNSK